jgi:hypothetical protein
LLAKANGDAEKVEKSLSQQNNELKEVLEKHKNCKQMCFDMSLSIILLVLLGGLFKLLNSKGYL